MKLFQVGRMTALAVTLLAAAAALAQVNMVYVESNVGSTANQNSVYAYSNDGTGVLTQVAGSPFLTGGTGVRVRTSSTANAFTSDSQLAVNAAGTFLFAVNGNSNTIASMAINSDGTLTPVAGSPFASNGSDPVSLSVSNAGPAGDLLLVANEANDPKQVGAIPNFTTFRIAPIGTLTAVSGSTLTEVAGSMPSQVQVNPGQKFAFGLLSQNGGSLISWAIGIGGKLVQETVLTPPNGGTSFLGMTNNALFKTVYVGLPDQNLIGVYSYDTLGNLTFDKTVVDPGVGIGFLTSNKEATVMYSAETTSDSVTVWDINVHQLTPTVLQHITLSPGGAPSSIMLDPTEKFLYVLCPNLTGVGLRGSFLHVLNVNDDGTLTETLAPLAIPVVHSAEPQGLAVVMK
jgi:6-phosphogluconolactonase (cycloisomerase 2 family)